MCAVLHLWSRAQLNPQVRPVQLTLRGCTTWTLRTCQRQVGNLRTITAHRQQEGPQRPDNTGGIPGVNRFLREFVHSLEQYSQAIVEKLKKEML